MFTVAGVSSHNGKMKVRFANDIVRVKILAKHGHEKIRFLELPKEMDKPEVVTYLKTTDLYEDPLARVAIDDADEKYNGTAVVKATKKAKSAAVKSATATAHSTHHAVKAGSKDAPKKEPKKPKQQPKPAPKVGTTTTLADLKSRAAKKAKETADAE